MKVFIRKVRSTIKKMYAMYLNRSNHIKLYMLEENIVVGKNIKFGKNIKIKTTDNGKITIGDNVSIEDNVYIYAQKGEILIKDNTFIGYGSQIVSKESITIGENNLVSAYTVIRDANHGIKKSSLISRQLHDTKAITIKNDVWIGAHSVVTSGSKIEKGAVIGANSVVTKNIEEYSVVGGVPAKYIKMRKK